MICWSPCITVGILTIGSDFAHCYKKKASPPRNFYCPKSSTPFFWPNSLLSSNGWLKYFWREKIVENTPVLCVYIEAINSQFYEHFLMIVEQGGLDKWSVIMGKGYGDYARLNLKPIQVENLFSTKKQHVTYNWHVKKLILDLCTRYCLE